jgi:uncharacterized membrane protein YjgN (DUF898 family)
MSFGPHAFRAEARWQPIFSRFLLYYLVPIIVVFGAILIAAIGAATIHTNPGEPPAGSSLVAFALLAIAFYAIFFGVLGVIAMVYYAAYFREAVGKLSLGELDFAFGADTADWIRLFLGNIGLVIVTFGVGTIFLAYRNWAFFVRHLEAYGEVRLDDLTQSPTRQPGQGEGLLDAFDIGAF